MNDQENKTTHTPLPWEIKPVCMGGRGKHAIYRPCVSADNKIIADMTWPAFGGTNSEKAERRANGLLIIEACNNYEALKAREADLLAALEAAILDYDNYDDRGEWIASARAAIKKAKGAV